MTSELIAFTYVESLPDTYVIIFLITIFALLFIAFEVNLLTSIRKKKENWLMPEREVKNIDFMCFLGINFILLLTSALLSTLGIGLSLIIISLLINLVKAIILNIKAVGIFVGIVLTILGFKYFLWTIAMGKTKTKKKLGGKKK